MSRRTGMCPGQAKSETTTSTLLTICASRSAAATAGPDAEGMKAMMPRSETGWQIRVISWKTSKSWTKFLRKCIRHSANVDVVVAQRDAQPDRGTSAAEIRCALDDARPRANGPEAHIEIRRWIPQTRTAIVTAVQAHRARLTAGRRGAANTAYRGPQTTSPVAPGQAAPRRPRDQGPSKRGNPAMKNTTRVCIIGGGVVGASVALPPDETGLVRRHAAGTARADLGLHLARGGRVPHAQRQHQHGGAARLHDPALQGTRGAHRHVLRAAPRGRHHAGRQPRPLRHAARRAGQAPLHGPRHRDHRAGGDRQARAHHQSRRHHRRAL